MVDPVTLKKALGERDTFAVAYKNHDLFVAAAREYLAFLEEFPTDEDVEVGVKAVEQIWGVEQVIRTRAYGWVRAALQAVAEARRQR